MRQYASYGLGVAALSLLLSVSASAATLAQQCGAVGIVTYDAVPVPTVSAGILARQCGAFGIVTYDPSETQTTEVPVPYAWLDTHVSGVVHGAEAYEALAKAMAANGRKVWECYVVGLDPQDLDDFRITSFPMKADGTPDLENLEFEPMQDKWNVPGARPVVKGAARLGGEWQAVTEENKAGFRFFKVEVVLP